MSRIARRERFSKTEDEKLADLVGKYGADDWRKIACMMGNRNSRQCKDRWCCFLSPSVNCGPWTEEEERELGDRYSEFGGHWAQIKKFFPSRSDTALKNRWMLILRREGGLEEKKPRKAAHKRAKMAPAEADSSDAVVEKPFISELFEDIDQDFPIGSIFQTE